MRTIWKFELEITDEQKISMPKNAKILSVQAQHDRPCVWAIVDDKEILEDRFFIIHGAGHPCNGGFSKFIGTFQVHSGRLVFHLFEK